MNIAQYIKGVTFSVTTDKIHFIEKFHIKEICENIDQMTDEQISKHIDKFRIQWYNHISQKIKDA